MRATFQMSSQPAWTPFERAVWPEEHVNNPMISDTMVFLNSRYQVAARVVTLYGSGNQKALHLSIKLRAGGHIHDWRELQRIKNEIPALAGWGDGRFCEGVELYPSEERLVDSANQYHLYLLSEGILFPFGFTERLVGDGPVPPGKIGSQRPFKLGEKPPDALSSDELQAALDNLFAGDGSNA